MNGHLRILSRLAPALLALLLPAAHAQAAEIITIRTGQTGGVPGSCPGFDDGFRYTLHSGCGTGFPGAFVAGDFADAAAGPAARLVAPVISWLPGLASDPQARWINWQIWTDPGPCTGFPPRTLLYAYKFRVNTCEAVASISACWAVDDRLGDSDVGGPNTVGMYINGVPLDAGFSGGRYDQENCWTQAGIPLITGDNWLYVYQRDVNCGSSGLIMSATLTVNSGLCPSILAHKFNDLNFNGIQEPNEPGISGWPIQLAGPVAMSDTTDGDGNVTFSCLPVGNYQVTETTDPNWVQTAPTGGIVNVAVECEMEFSAAFGNHLPDWEHCSTLPSCLAAWFPFDEGAGTTANEVMSGRDGTITGGSGSPSWAGFGPNSPSYLQFPGGAGTQSVICPDYPEHDFGTGSFSIFAWIRTTNADGISRVIVDKRVGPFLTPTGYVLYLRDGVLGLQLGTGSGAASTFLSTAPLCNDGQWHTVAAAVCRDPANPSANVVRLAVDSYLDTFTAGIPTGSLSNSAGLTIGDQSSGPDLAFNGSIDEVQLYPCCLSAGTLVSLASVWPYCKEQCSLPSMLNSFGSLATTTLNICNYTLTPQTYVWSVAGVTGSGCPFGPTAFSPFSGTVTVPPATNGPSCASIPITMVLPSGMASGQIACYTVTFINTACGCAHSCSGKIRKSSPFSTHAVPAEVAVPIGVAVPVGFMVRNHGGLPLVLDYRLVDPGSEGDPGDVSIELNGLPPGEPVFGTLSLAPGDSGMVNVTAELTAHRPFLRRELVLETDADGDGEPDPLDCLVFVSAPEGALTGVPGTHLGAEPARALSQLIAAVPNPFRDETAVEFQLAAGEPAGRVDVYDVSGRLVRRLHAGPLAAGRHRLAWDGKDERGTRSSAGIYFVRAQAGERTLMTKVMRIE